MALTTFAAFYSHWPAERWSAIAAWLTFGIAVVAAVVAYHQVREARRLREAQAQPYVVAYLGESFPTPGHGFLDLVVKNFGATAAIDIAVAIDPDPRRYPVAMGEVRVDIPPIRTLVPGQEWRTYWDALHTRKLDQHLPDRHTATVSFSDTRGENHTFAFDLDFGQFKHQGNIIVYGTHEAAKALRDIHATVKRWDESPGKGLRTFVRDGDARDKRIMEEREKRRSRPGETDA
jgi:hypothetical protein